MGEKPFIGGTKPSIADMRLAATLEFLGVIDYSLPAWAATYMAAIEKSLGNTYSEPAADVRGYIDYVRAQRQEELTGNRLDRIE
jgi:glutathione S-transferase